VTESAGNPVAPLGTQAYNPAFDITPAGLITAIVTENGVVSPVTPGDLAALCSPRAPGHDQVMG
jgi:methylthioribose-1-phosphate isomerase